ncbi:MAG TPA: chitobiase/beta-hexosaminidase C-terminal domain-containing protein [Muribaculaceae bacterium]|nr:chitobiase/beta-hexosaminidase C-terminal domain-containing protein [Muribaculaceae bacterium]
MVITYGESVAPETKPEKPTFSVTPGEVAKGTSVTISSKGATSLTLKSKTADAADWTIQNIPNANTHDVIINENITYDVVGHNSIGDSEAAEASYTVKADTPVPGGNITATVIFKNQTNFTYESGKNVVWVAEEYPSITFSTSATSKQNYPKKDGNNLRMYTSSSNKITVNAPEGYKIKSVSGVYTNTSNTGFKINNETTVVKSGVPYEFAEDVSSFVLVSYKKSGANKSANSTYFSSFTFVLVPDAPVVPEAPSAVTVTPAKAEAKVGENVSVTIAANGTPAPDIYYTIDGTTPTTESAKYAKAFDVTCDALADNEESKVVTINGLAQNSEGQASGSATVAFTRNDASITVKDAKGNTIGADGASLVLEDGATEFKATSTGDGTIHWSSADNKIAKVENGIITPLAVGTTTITASSDKTGKYNACETSFILTITSPYTYATVTFRRQKAITYTSNTKADWVSEPVDGTTYTFESSVGKLQNTGYPSNNVNPSSGKATNLTITKISGVPISVQAPEGYVIVRVSYATTKTYDTPAIAINGEDLAAKSYRDFPKGATTIDLTPGTGLNNPTISSMTFALTKVVAPASLTINPNKTEAVIGQTVSVKIVADDAAFPAPTIYYTRDGSTPVPGANKTETYDPAKGFTLARTVPQTVTINAIAVNSGGQVAAEPVSIVFNDKDHVAPTSISFSQTEGTYPENATFNVKLAADAAAYPTPTLYYTIGGYTAQGDNHIAYDDVQGIDVAKPADGNVVTINAYAVNDAGAVINAATYVFSSEISTATGWIRVQDASQLSDGLNVIVAYAPNGNASTTLSLMTPEVSSNGGLSSADVTCNNTNGVITGDISNAQHVILEGNATDGWYLKLYNNDKGYIMPKYNKSKKDYENGLAFTTDKSSAIPATIDLTGGNAYVTFNGTDREFVYNNAANRFGGYNNIADEQRRAIDFFSEGEYTAGKPYEDLYLVMKTNEIGGAEVAMPFTYEGDGRYTLPIYNLQGTFYIRDGKANHSGTYFGAKADECIDPETSTGYVGHSINAAISAIKGEPSTGVKDGNGKDVYAYVGKNSGRDSYTLIYDPAQESHYVFSTHPNTNIGHVARIDYAMLTVEYTPGSHTDGVLRISGMSTTGVDDISADVNGQARYFNLQGMPVANPTAGIYIRVIGDTATKVCIK